VGNYQKYIDQLGCEVLIPVPPKRIVSLVPSQTELLSDLGLEDQVVGITKFCVHPAAWRNHKAIIGGTKKFDFNMIKGLNPDLIIGNKEENYQDGIEQLKEIAPVWMSDITSLEDATQMILELGKITGREEISHELANTVLSSFDSLIQVKPKTVLYLIWYNPWMAAATETFIHTMLSKTGVKNCLENVSRYPELTNDEIKRLNPDFVFLSSEPFPFRQKHVDELQQILPASKIISVDGEMFSWYGSRLKLFVNYFNTAVRPLLL
jgi:ABC-type Fe3+-hydroxamate transport system substrate-binding protein